MFSTMMTMMMTETLKNTGTCRSSVQFDLTKFLLVVPTAATSATAQGGFESAEKRTRELRWASGD